MKTTLLTSAFEPRNYIKQYCMCIRSLNRLNVHEIEIAFGMVLAVHLKERQAELDEIQAMVQEAADDAGVGVYFTRAEAEVYPVTINKLIKLSRAENVAIWNIDDWRYSKGIGNQIGVLGDYDFTYGDFAVTTNVDMYMADPYTGQIQKTHRMDKDLSNRFYMAAYNWGPFIAWRRELNDRYGYYDERLKVVADYDWINRLLHYGLRIRRADDIIGIFTADGKGLSTRPDTEGHKENRFIHERFLGGKHHEVVNLGVPADWRKFK